MGQDRARFDVGTAGYERGWLRITDTATAEDLDQATARLSQAQSSAADDAETSGAPGGPCAPPKHGRP